MNFDFDVQGDTIRMISGDGTPGETYDIGTVALVEDCAVTQDTVHILGTAVGALLTFTVDTTEIVEGSRFDYYAMVQEADGTEVTTYCGTFTAIDVVPVTATSLVSVTAIDGMINFNVPHTSALDYASGTVTLWDVVEELCTACGVPLSDEQPEALQNAGFVVAANPFPAGTLGRAVLAHAAMVLGAFAQMVGGELRFVVPSDAADSVATISTADCATLTLSRTVRKYNGVVIRSSTNDDDIETMQEDDPGDAPETPNLLLVEDNPFLYDAATRSAAIEGIFDNACGFAYYPFEAIGVAHPALKCGDSVTVLDENGVAYASLMLRMEYHSADEAGGMNNAVCAPGETLAAVEYTYPKSKAEELARLAYIQSQAYAAAVQQISALLNTPGESYVKYKKHIEGVLTDCQATDSPEEIWFTSKETVDGTTNILRLNSAGLGYSSDGGATYRQALTGIGLLASSIVFDAAVGAKMIVGVADGQRFEIYASGGEPYIDAYDAAGNLRSRWNYNGLTFANSGGDSIVNISTTVEDMTITVGEGKDYAHPQAAVDAISQYFINHDITIRIDPGTYEGSLVIKNKAGYGSITITAAATEMYTITGYFEAVNIGCGLSTDYMNALFFNIDNCRNYGAWTPTCDAEHDNGFIIYNSNAGLGNVTISNKTNLAIQSQQSNVYIFNINGEDNNAGYTNSGGSFTISNDDLQVADEGLRYDGLFVVDNVVHNSEHVLVAGPESATAGNLAALDATGKVLSDSGLALSGWIAASGWNYSEPGKISVQDGTKFRLGYYLKYVQTTTKYAQVIGISGNTLTITGGNAYPLTSADITAMYYSPIAPADFPANFTWTPQIGADTNPTLTYDKQWGEFVISGNRVFLEFWVTITALSGGSGNVTIKNFPVATGADITLRKFDITYINTTGLTVKNYGAVDANGGRTYALVTYGNHLERVTVANLTATFGAFGNINYSM